jgi:phosphoribosylformylglycinamidine synthase I
VGSEQQGGAGNRGGGTAAGSQARPRVLIITGDGLNCERETALAFELAGAEPHLVHITDILSQEKRLDGYAILAFIGGFSNGDHLGAGTVQASRFRHALREDLEQFIAAGRPIIGICNGFQTVVKMGILPGMPSSGGPGKRADCGASTGPWRQTATITVNDSGRFEDRWVRLAIDPRSPCIWTRGLKRLFVPVRHGEGKFVMIDRELLEALLRRHLVVARYADDRGKATQEYPFNPNGSLLAVAGICDQSGLIFGLMPHPEAFLSPYNHPSWTRRAALGRPLAPEGEGLAMFRNAVRHVGGAGPAGEAER